MEKEAIYKKLNELKQLIKDHSRGVDLTKSKKKTASKSNQQKRRNKIKSNSTKTKQKQKDEFDEFSSCFSITNDDFQEEDNINNKHSLDRSSSSANKDGKIKKYAENNNDISVHCEKLEKLKTQCKNLDSRIEAVSPMSKKGSSSNKKAIRNSPIAKEKTKDRAIKITSNSSSNNSACDSECDSQELKKKSENNSTNSKEIIPESNKVNPSGNKSESVSSKSSSVKSSSKKSTSSKQESLKPGSSKHDSSNHDPLKNDTLKNDSSKHDSSKHDSSEHDSTKHDSTKHDSSKHDSSKHDSTKHDSTKHDSTKHDSSENDSSEHDSSKHDSTKHDSTKHDSSKTESSESESPKFVDENDVEERDADFISDLDVESDQSTDSSNIIDKENSKENDEDLNIGDANKKKQEIKKKALAVLEEEDILDSDVDLLISSSDSKSSFVKLSVNSDNLSSSTHSDSDDNRNVDPNNEIILEETQVIVQPDVSSNAKESEPKSSHEEEDKGEVNINMKKEEGKKTVKTRDIIKKVMKETGIDVNLPSSDSSDGVFNDHEKLNEREENEIEILALDQNLLQSTDTYSSSKSEEEDQTNRNKNNKSNSIIENSEESKNEKKNVKLKPKKYSSELYKVLI